MSEATMPESPVEIAREMSAEIAVKRMFTKIGRMFSTQVLSFLFVDLPSVRFYLIDQQGRPEELWEIVRSSEEVTDFVVLGTQELVLRFESIISSTDTLAECLADSLTCLTHDASKIDKDFLDRLPLDQQTLADALKANKWICFLMLLETVDFYQYLPQEITMPSPEEVEAWLREQQESGEGS